MSGGKQQADAYKNVLGLRAMRQFEDRPLSEADLQAILEAGRWTGSSKNLQDWALVVVNDSEQKERLAACGDFTDPVRRAPVAFALVQEPDGYEFDIGRLAQNLMLAAKAIGVATCPVTFHRSDDAALVLGLPAGAKARYGIAAGYPAPADGATRYGGRRDLDSFVRWNSY